MPLYMTQFSYTTQAWAALAHKPEDRGAAFERLVERFGGTFKGLYYMYGDYDGLVLYEAPDNQTATAIAVAAVVPGHLKVNQDDAPLHHGRDDSDPGERRGRRLSSTDRVVGGLRNPQDGNQRRPCRRT